MDQASDQPATSADNPDQAFRLYAERGFHVEPGVLTPDECAALIAAGRAIAAKGEGNFRPLMQPHRDDAGFLRAMAKPRLTRIMERLCGGPVSGLQSELFFCRPGTPGFMPHQDNYFVEAPDGAFASVWTALVDVHPGNGGLVLYPGSHRRGLLPVERLGGPASPHQDPNAAAQRTLLPTDHASGIDLSLRAGDAVLLHGWVVHASHDNCSEGWRYALLNTYIRQGAPFRPGAYARRAPVDLAAVAAA